MEYLDPFLIQAKYDLVGLSTESKPTKVKDGSTFLEVNTSKLYVFYNNNWYNV